MKKDMKEEKLLSKLRKVFKVEAGERLTKISSGLLELEKASGPDAQHPILEEAFREAHSLKGAARAVNLTEIEMLCQSVESVFAALQQEAITVSPELFDTLYDAVRTMENFLAASKKEQANIKGNIEHLIHQVEDLKKGGEKQAQIKEEKGEEVSPAKASREPQAMQIKPLISETVRISTSKLDSILLKAQELVSLKLAWGQHLFNLRSTMHSFENWKKNWNKVESELRMLIRKVQKEGELANLAEFLDWNRDYFKTLGQEMQTLVKATEQDQRTLGRMVDDLLDDMKEVTMLPFSTLADLLPRMVREISRDQGKEVDLVLEGGDIRIDRRILEEMKDPLIHLLRNAIDHGIEEPERRKEQKKPDRGTINLNISQTEGNKVEILVSDDGEGIDLPKVREETAKRRIITKKEAEHLEDQETLPLIFRSGVSTNPIITEISGRGLGLAIVQERIEKLGGLLSVQTTSGMGTSVRIQLLVTLATFRGILIQAADNHFIVPSSHVESVLRIQQEEIQTVENKATIPLNGRTLSLVDIADVLELTPKESQSNGETFITAMVLGAGEKRIAFKITELMGEQEVLVKSLGKQLSRVRNIAGASVLGSGQVVPILNVPDLVKSAVRVNAGPARAAVEIKKVDERKKSILVVEDSITSRMLLKNILEASGFLVKTAVDGAEAFTTLKTEDFDLIVSDVDMPRMDGFALTSKIRSDKKLGDLPVVLVTALESREDRERGIDVGANAYIVKSSFDQSNLLEVVRRLI